MKVGLRCQVLAATAVIVVTVGCGGGGGTSGGTSAPSDLERFNAGFFTIDKPKDWEVTTAGMCSTLAVLVRDPANPLRQIYYFGTVGPVYLNAQQKQIDQAYVNAGGFPNTWMDAPVVDPFTPDNFLAHWPEIAAMKAASQFMPQFPHLDGLQVVSRRQLAAQLPGGSTGQVRGVFGSRQGVGEGMFMSTVSVYFPFTGSPGQGNGYGHIVCGVTAPKDEFPASMDKLIRSLESFTITDSYVQACLVQMAQVWGAVAKAGQTLSEASDILYEGWKARSTAEDIMAEMATDTSREYTRAVDPATGNVYAFPNEAWSQYEANPGAYNVSDLQALPANSPLYLNQALDGPSNVHR
jgi:hypothetical protein